MDLAVSAAKGNVDSVIGKLGDLLYNEYKLVAGARADIEFLKSELTIINAFLEDMSVVENPNKRMRAWMKDVRELAYDIEQSIDQFLVFWFRREEDDDHRSDSESKMGRLRSKVRKRVKIVAGFVKHKKQLLTTACVRHRIANELRRLKARTVEVAERRQRYDIQYTESKDGSVASSITENSIIYTDGNQYGKQKSESTASNDSENLRTDENNHIGLEEIKEDLKSWILKKSSNQGLRVLSIVGVGGIGKTTLAMDLYSDVKSSFDYAEAVTVSQKYNSKMLFQSLLKKQISENDSSNIMLLREELREKLKGSRRYFLIIDDLWDINHWRDIKSAFPESGEGNKVILVTTRIHSVGETCSRSGIEYYVVDLPPLNNQDATALFNEKIFGPKIDCPLDLKDVAGRILKKCGGNPLAIVCLASALASKPRNKTEWQRVCNAIGFQMEINSDMERVKNILSLSYNFLPCHLKTCCMYLSAFPEDFSISQRDITDLWIAEGFIASKRGIDIMQVAESYLDQLIDRNMVMPYVRFYDGWVLFSVHDIILEIIVQHAKEENFFTIVENKSKIDANNKIRRLSFQGNKKDMEVGLLSAARTLIVCEDVQHIPKLTDFKWLRVLFLRWYPTSLTKKDLVAICNLVMLKYLALKKIECDKFPKNIKNLVHLEFLYLEGVELPKEFLKLRKLILLSPRGCKLPDGYADYLKTLQLLYGVKFPDTCKAKEVAALQDLRTLFIEDSSIDSEDIAKFQSLNKLEDLELFNCTITGRLQGWIKELSRVRRLDMWDIEEVHLEDLMSFSKMESLLNLLLGIKLLKRGEDIQGPFGAFTALKFFGFDIKGKWDSSIQLLTFGPRSFQELEEFNSHIRCEDLESSIMSDVQPSDEDRSLSLYHDQDMVKFTFRSLPKLKKIVLWIHKPTSLTLIDLPLLDGLDLYFDEESDRDIKLPLINCDDAANVPKLKSVYVNLPRSADHWVHEALSSLGEFVSRHPNNIKHNLDDKYLKNKIEETAAGFSLGECSGSKN